MVAGYAEPTGIVVRIVRARILQRAAGEQDITRIARGRITQRARRAGSFDTAQVEGAGGKRGYAGIGVGAREGQRAGAGLIQPAARGIGIREQGLANGVGAGKDEVGATVRDVGFVHDAQVARAIGRRG